MRNERTSSAPSLPGELVTIVRSRQPARRHYMYVERCVDGRNRRRQMFQRILVPLDGSARSEQAVPIAARIAHATPGSHVVLVRVMPSLYQDANGMAGVAGVMGAERGALLRPSGTIATDPERLNIVGYLTRITGWPCLSGIPTTTEVRWGPPAVAILAAAEAYASDLIVLCSHGRTGPSRWVLGSVAQQVVRHAPMLVLVLRERGSRLTGAPNGSYMPLQVLVPLDGSPLAEEVLRPAVELALAVSGMRTVTVHLALVVSPFDVVESQMPEAFALVGAEAYLRHVAQRLEVEAPVARVVWHVYAGVDIAYTLLHGADSAAGQEVAVGAAHEAHEAHDADGGDDTTPHYDLLAMTTHGRTGITRWATGSITERVLQQAQLPLLVVRSHQTRAPVAELDSSRATARVSVGAGAHDDGSPPSR